MKQKSETRGAVLIVEDRVNWQDMLSQVLEEEQYQIQVASNAQEARALIRTNEFDLAIMDLRLDDSDPNNFEGLELLSDFSKASSRTRAIVLTGYATVPVAVKAMANEKTVYLLEKQTFDSEKFLELVREAMQHVPPKGKPLSKADYLRGMTLDEMVSHLVLEGKRFHGKREHREMKGTLNAIVTNLLSGLEPLIPDPKGVQKVTDKAGNVIAYEARFWSKELGEGILLRIGEQQKSIPAKTKKLREYTLQNVAGYVYRLPQTKVNDFDKE